MPWNTKTNDKMPYATTCMDLEIIILSEVRERHSHYITYMWYLKNATTELTKQKQTHKYRKQMYDCPRGKVGSRIN